MLWCVCFFFISFFNKKKKRWFKPACNPNPLEKKIEKKSELSMRQLSHQQTLLGFYFTLLHNNQFLFDYI